MEDSGSPTADGQGIKLLRYEDVIYADYGIGMANPEWGVKQAKRFQYKSGDVIICSYPKCGTHWLGNMAFKLQSLDRKNRSLLTFLEFNPLKELEALESPRIIFTHLKPSRLPADHLQKRGKIVLILRNPKDAMVSYYHHLKNVKFCRNKQTWDEFFQSYIDGIIPMGSYFDYIQQWEQFLKEKPIDLQVEIFFYEDFKANLNNNIARLNDFLGLNRDEKYVERVKKATTFTALREQYAPENGGCDVVFQDKEGKCIIYRKGEIGDWKNYLTVRQSETVDQLMTKRLRYGILNIKYEM